MKIIFFDLDGTLLMPDHYTVSKRTCEALVCAREMGTRLAVATGRSCALLPKALKGLPIDFFITSNGADVVDAHSGKQIYSSYLSKGEGALAWEIIGPEKMFVEWNINQQIAVDRATSDHIEMMQMPPWHRAYFDQQTYPIIETPEAFFAQGAPKLEKINLLRDHPDKISRVWNALDETGQFELSSALGKNVEVNQKGCTKGKAIRFLAKYLDIPIGQSMAFGDGGNDVEMLSTVGVGVAMGNASDKLKAIADYVTLSNEEEGVAEFIQKFLLHE